MSDIQTSPAAPRSRTGLLLLVSLVINLFLIGVIATAMWTHRDGPDRGGHGGPLGFLFGDVNGAKSSMTDEDRAALKKMMMGSFKTIRPQLDNIDEARKALGRAIAATPYDPAKVAAAFDGIESAQMSVGGQMRAVMVKGFGEMNDAQRQRLGKIMEENAERDWRRKNRGKGPDGPDGPNGPDGNDGPPPPPPGE
ncbi:MAG: periplasmic heavy metal sensor [Parvibaculaceae bacterium]